MAEPLTASADATDTYQSLADLFELTGTGLVALEGLLQAQTQAMEIQVGPTSQPTGAGQVYSETRGIAFGPVGEDAGYALNRIWVRNETAGSTSTIVFIGQVI